MIGLRRCMHRVHFLTLVRIQSHLDHTQRLLEACSTPTCKTPRAQYLLEHLRFRVKLEAVYLRFRCLLILQRVLRQLP